MRPTNKVTAGALSGAISAIACWALTTFGHVTLPPEIAIAASTIIAFVVQYFVSDSAPPEETPQ